jgi:5-methylthioadenosine/S-adenosylhomocysteine deaminase
MTNTSSEVVLVRAAEIVTATVPLNEHEPSTALLVIDGAIAEIGEFERLSASHPEARRIGSPEHVAIPGFVNSHHHGWGVTSFQLGALDDSLEPWMIELMGVRHKVLDPYLDTMLSDSLLLRSGVTSVTHFSEVAPSPEAGDVIRAALRAHLSSGIRAVHAVNVRDRFRFVYSDDAGFLASLPESARRAAAPVSADQTSEDIDALFDLYHESRHHDPTGRVQTILAAEGPEWCTDGLLLRVREVATADDVPLQIHVMESPLQTEWMHELYGESAIAHLARIGFFTGNTSISHGVWLSTEDIEILAGRGVSVLHNPTSNLRLRNGIMPIHALRRAGVNVALGTDSTSFRDDDDYFDELRMARLLHSLPGPEGLAAPMLGGADLFEMATINGARTTMLGDSVGRLEVGRRADIVLLRREALTGAYLNPAHSLIDACVYRGSKDAVDTVLVDGQVVVQDGRCLLVDEQAVLAELRGRVLADSDERIAPLIDAARALRRQAEHFYSDWRPQTALPTYLVNSAASPRS